MCKEQNSECKGIFPQHNLEILSKIFVGRKTMETAVALSMCRFSMGSSFQEILYTVMGIHTGTFLKHANAEKDSQRLLSAEKNQTIAWKKKSILLKFKATKQKYQRETKEGETYGAGSFNSS